MKAQWSIAYALVALAVVAWTIAIVTLAEPRYSQIDYPQILYELKLSSMNAVAIYCAEYQATPWAVFCNNTPLAITGVNRSFLIYHNGLVAARLSRVWGPVNYTLFLAVINCTTAVAPNGGIVHVAYIAISSTLDYLPELYVNTTSVEKGELEGSSYLSPSAVYIIAVLRGRAIQIVDFPVSVVLSCFT